MMSDLRGFTMLCEKMQPQDLIAMVNHYFSEMYEEISRYKQLMNDDAEIISLRAAVRKAAESKLSHGIIDVNDLLREINQENAARVQQSIHEIEMLKEIYDNKITTNN
jgi:hypothetical protein